MKPKGGKIASDKTHQIFCQIVPCNKQATLQNLTAKCIICAGYSPLSTLRATMAECLMSDASSRTICMSQTRYVVDMKKMKVVKVLRKRYLSDSFSTCPGSGRLSGDIMMLPKWVGLPPFPPYFPRPNTTARDRTSPKVKWCKPMYV